MIHTKEQIEKMSQTELLALAANNARKTWFEYCPKCGCLKEDGIICWNCEYRGEE